MPQLYFKDQYLVFMGVVPEQMTIEYDLTITADYFSDEEIELLKKGAKYDGNTVVIPDEMVLAAKKEQCQKAILAKYSDRDQTNILMFGTDEEKKEMTDYIKTILTEYRTKGKDADFSAFLAS